MPSTETQRNGKSKKNSKKIAQEVASKVVEELEEQRYELPFDATDEGEETDSTEDIFVGPATEVIKHGGTPRFKVKKNGEFLVTKNHPYSWDRLQKDFGGGFYQVVCINQKGQHVKSESQTVAELPGRNNEDLGLGFGGGNHQDQEENDGGFGSNSKLMGMLTFLKTFNSDAEAKARDAVEREKNNSTSSMGLITTLLTTMMKEKESSASSSNQILLKMMEMQQQNTKDLADNMAKVMQNMNDRFEKLFSKKDDGMSVLQLQKEIREAEARGEARADKIHDLIERKSEEKADLKAELMSANEGDGSLLSSLTKNILPLVAKSYEAQQANAAAQAQEQAQIRAQVNQRPRIPVEGRQFVPATPGSAMSGAATPNGQARRPVLSPEEQAQRAIKFKELVLSKVLEPIAEGLGSQKQPEEVAFYCVELLKKDKITAKHVVDNFSSQDIIKIALELGLPPEVKPWLTEFYAAVERMAFAPKAVSSQQPITSLRKESPVRVVNPELVTEKHDVNIQTPPRANDAKVAGPIGAEVS